MIKVLLFHMKTKWTCAHTHTHKQEWLSEKESVLKVEDSV